MDAYTTDYVCPYRGHPNDPRNDGFIDAEVDRITSLVTGDGMDPVEALKRIDWERPHAETIYELAVQELVDNGDLPEGFNEAA